MRCGTATLGAHCTLRTTLPTHLWRVSLSVGLDAEGVKRGRIYYTVLIGFAFTGRDADDETLDQSEIRVWLDMSNQQIGIMLNRDLQVAYREFAQQLLRVCDNNPKLGDVPIQFKAPIYGTNDPSFTDFVAPGVILT